MSPRWIVCGLVVGALACGGGGEGATSSESAIRASPDVEQALAQLRRVVAPFHDFAKAEAAGWSAPITPCLESPDGEGAMGIHYGNVALIDGTVELLRPELLLYEPLANGRLRFVGVEYIVPYTFAPRDGPAPELLGQAFHQNDTFQLWGLHIWVGRHNPSGMFADWNPEVSCAFAP
jgi:hypothetical protein